MTNDFDKFKDIKIELRKLQNKKDNRIAAFSVKASQQDVSRPEIFLSWVGSANDEVTDFINKHQNADIDPDPIEQDYYFLGGGELRPGSGLIRVFGGRPEGPGGTLTCLLSSKDGQDIYFVSAGHVLTNFWRCNVLDSLGSIYRYRKGFPATNSTRFLGKCLYLPKDLPKTIEQYPMGKGVNIDIGIVKLEGEAELKQRTTCYGSFGEWPKPTKATVRKCKFVMKCGSQEPHWTVARIKKTRAEVLIYGPDGVLYTFRDQIILEDLRAEISDGRNNCTALQKDKHPQIPPETPFAVPGDSGTMVVDKDTKRPVGMLIAGSILNGRYVMTPFRTMAKFWEGIDLTMLRA